MLFKVLQLSGQVDGILPNTVLVHMFWIWHGIRLKLTAFTRSTVGKPGSCYACTRRLNLFKISSNLKYWTSLVIPSEMSGPGILRNTHNLDHPT